MFYHTKLKIAKFIWKHKMERSAISAMIKLQDKHGGLIRPTVYKQVQNQYRPAFTHVRHQMVTDEMKKMSISEIIKSFPMQPTDYHNFLIRDYDKRMELFEQ